MCSNPATLPAALAGVQTAYYLIHSLQGGVGFHQRDLDAARAFGHAAAAAGVQRLIYLGGLGDPATALSPHLRSRQQTGDALRAAGVPETEWQDDGVFVRVQVADPDGYRVELFAYQASSETR